MCYRSIDVLAFFLSYSVVFYGLIMNDLGERPQKRSRIETLNDSEGDLKSRKHEKKSKAHGNHIKSPSPSSSLNINKVDKAKKTQNTLGHPILQGCRSVSVYEILNHIEEGTYGIVYRAQEKQTGQIVALKKLKMEQEREGFPITSLREIKTLMACSAHDNIVRVREIVVGKNLNQIYIVFDFIEHDLKTLLSTMRTPFLVSEIKTMMLQLLSAMALCHENWIVHRDLKTSNLLMNNRGQIKVADFGLARTYGEPLGSMTPVVVTLWYRSPELLLGAKDYSTAVDMWSVGCIFAELIQKEPLFPGKSEPEQLNMIFKVLGRPSELEWPEMKYLPNTKLLNLDLIQPYSTLRKKFRSTSDAGINLMTKLLTYDPQCRISAEEAMRHPYFKESPLPKHPDMFQSFPSAAAGEKRRVYESPSAPEHIPEQISKHLEFGFVTEFDFGESQSE